MSIGGRTYRAFRPSQFARQDEVEENWQEAKLEKIQLYIERAEAGIPLFESDVVADQISIGRKFAM